MPTRTGKPSKYDPLLQWLQALPPEQQHAVLTFDQIAALIGPPLPAGIGSTVFWADTARRVLRPAGFIAQLHRLEHTVDFTRVAQP